MDRHTVAIVHHMAPNANTKHDSDHQSIATVKCLQKVDIMIFFGNLESSSCWRSCEVQTLCPFRHVTSASIAISTATASN